MSYPEPSRSDHNAPWNIMSIEDEDGETIEVCGCTSCVKAMRDAMREDYGIDEDYRRKSWER